MTLAVSGAALPSFGGHPIVAPVRLSGTETIGSYLNTRLSAAESACRIVMDERAAQSPFPRVLSTAGRVTLLT